MAARLFKKAGRADSFAADDPAQELRYQLARITRADAGGQPQRPADEIRKLALAMLLLAGCNEKQVYLPLPPAEVRIAQLILLIALSAKNAILIVGFARDLHLKDGLPLADAAIEAARQRLRPIAMTSLAFILGLLPPTHRSRSASRR